MGDPIFQNAYNRVRGRHSDQAWFALTPREITNSIYEEMRIMDQERVMSVQTGIGQNLPMAAE